MAPQGAEWSVGTPQAADAAQVRRLTELLRAHQQAGRGWASAGESDVVLELRGRGRRNVVVRDEDGLVRGWGSVHDRASGRVLLLHVVDRSLAEERGRRCSDLLVEWAVDQAREIGAARGLAVQQVDSGAFEGDEWQRRWLSGAGFVHVRTWWQMSRPVLGAEVGLVDDPRRWDREGVVVRLAEDDEDRRTVHDVLEAAFTDHFNSKPETFEEFSARLGEDPGHRWDHWWLAEVDGTPAGALVATQSGSASYVAYVGVVGSARGRGVAKGLLRTVVADAAARGRTSVALEVDADSPTGADRLYRSMGWTTSYVTESWHRDVPVT